MILGVPAFFDRLARAAETGAIPDLTKFLRENAKQTYFYIVLGELDRDTFERNAIRFAAMRDIYMGCITRWQGSPD